jgi:hypothetical protein
VHGQITVETAHGRLYRLDGRRQHNAFELDGGEPVREFCIHAPHNIPLYDHLAAQVLMLQAEPDEFDRIANVWDLRRGRAFVSSSGHELVAA